MLSCDLRDKLDEVARAFQSQCKGIVRENDDSSMEQIFQNIDDQTSLDINFIRCENPAELKHRSDCAYFRFLVDQQLYEEASAFLAYMETTGETHGSGISDSGLLEIDICLACERADFKRYHSLANQLYEFGARTKNPRERFSLQTKGDFERVSASQMVIPSHLYFFPANDWLTLVQTAMQMI